MRVFRAAGAHRQSARGAFSRHDKRRASSLWVATSDDYRWQNIRERVGLPLEAMVTSACAYCDFSVSAPLEQARQAFRAHHCNRPKPETTVRRRSGFALRATRRPGTY
jgi:hypothetical protein